MIVAKIDSVTNDIINIGDVFEMYPTTSFAATGPNQDFMDEQNLKLVDNVLIIGTNEKLVAADPYLDGNVVRTARLVPLTAAEIESREAARVQHKIQSFQAEAGRRLDNFAIARGYGSIISVCTYDTSTVPRYAADALRARALRDQWWEVLNQIVADVLASNRPEPDSFDDIVAELPALTWD